MNKIVQVVNAMIINSNKITDVTLGSHELSQGEYFFLYDKKYKWSINKSDNKEQYNLFFYPKEDITIIDLANTNFQEYAEFLGYHSEEIKTQEAVESFSELFKIVQAKLYDVDKIFEDILQSVPKKEIVIHSAKYGKDDKFNDVTEYVQGLVDSKLTKFKISNELFGGNDPKPGIVKELRIDCTVNNMRKQLTGNEHQSLTIE